MTTIRIPDSIAFELRWLSLIGVFKDYKYNVSLLVSVGSIFES